MDDGLPFVLPFVLLPMVLLPALIVGVLLYQRHRVKAVRAWAAGTGWTYVGTDRSMVGRWSGRPFGLGHSKRVSELVVGLFQGRSAASFSYQYTTGSGKSQSTSTYHVLALALPAYLPTLELTPDGLGAKLAKTFGGQDIVFESEAFNRAWRVKAGDQKFAHDVVHPRLMERLLWGDAAGMSVRIEGTDVICWSAGGQRLAAIGPRLQVMCAIVNAVPRFVWLDHGYDPDTA